jgi:spermidine synthase
MNEQNRIEPARHVATGQYLPLLLLLFAGSGCSALIYEIVWFQLLQFVIGSSAVSLGVLLGTFMGGMCLGSIALPRLISRRAHPLRVYAMLELCLAFIGVAVLFGMPFVDHLYSHFGGHGFWAMLMRAAVCVVCLLPPTILMGATLPAIARWVETTRRGVSWLGLFYGGNIAGAVFGCLLAGFYLLRVHDMATATFLAATLNAAVALLSHTVAVWTPQSETRNPKPETRNPKSPASSEFGFRISDLASWPVYVTIALSGAGALAAEVVWTRLLSLMLGATVYTFSIILAVFLIGLGIGSSIGSYLARTSPRPRLLLGLCQLFLAAAIAWTAYMLGSSMPYWPIKPDLTQSPWFTFQLDLARCLWAILPAACLWGASFPLALASAAKPGQDPGRLTGGIYAANTVGAIIGAVGTSLLLIRWLGTDHAQRVLIGLSAVAALLMLVPYAWAFTKPRVTGGLEFVGVSLLVAGVAVAAWALMVSVPELSWELVAFGRSLPTYEGKWKAESGAWSELYVGEGMNSSIAVTKTATGVRSFHVSGKTEASSDPPDMRLQRMLGHMPALFHPKPRSVLVVGFGAGVTAGSFVVHPDIERIVICEIEPLVPQKVAEHFEAENYDVVHDPRVEIVYDDARHYILTTTEKFDIITSDPIHPWVKGSAALYTKEYFELCKRHLNPGGLVTQWVPLYESSADVVKSEIATFFDVFPHGTLWDNLRNGEGYDTVLLGQEKPLKIDADALQERLKRPDHAAVLRSLENVGFQTVVGLLLTYGGQASDLQPWLKNAQINRDRNLRLQYLAGLELNTFQSTAIHKEMLEYRQFPESLFIGSRGLSQTVRYLIENPIKRDGGTQQ